MVLAVPTDDTLNDHSLIQHNNEPNHPARLIPELCRNFYTLGWVTCVVLHLNDSLESVLISFSVSQWNRWGHQHP